MDNLRHSFAMVRIISRDVFRAASKERLMYGFLILSVLFILLANMPFMRPELFEEDSALTASLQIGFMGINIFLLLTSVFIGVNVLQDVCDVNNLSLLLSKPIKRWHILEGTYFGLFKIVFFNWLIMVSSLFMIVNFHTLEVNTFIWLGMSISLLLILIYVALVVFFYTLIPNAMSGIMTIFIIIAGFGVSITQDHLTAFAPCIKFFAAIGVEMVPKINLLFGISMNILGIFDLPIDAFPVVCHSFVFLVVVHGISYFKFRRPQ